VDFSFNSLKANLMVDFFFHPLLNHIHIRPLIEYKQCLMFSVKVDIMNTVSTRASAIMTLFNYEAWTGGTLFITSALRTDSAWTDICLSLYLFLFLARSSRSLCRWIKVNWMSWSASQSDLNSQGSISQKTSLSNSWADFDSSN